MIATITRMTTSVPRPIYMSTCPSGSETVGRHSSYVRQPPPGPVLVRGFALFFLSVGTTNPPTHSSKTGESANYFRCTASLALSITSSTLSSALSITSSTLSFAWSTLSLASPSATVGLAFGLEVLVAGEASDGLFGPALRLISLSSHRAPPSLRATPGSTGSTLLLCPDLSALARGESHVVEPDGQSRLASHGPYWAHGST